MAGIHDAERKIPAGLAARGGTSAGEQTLKRSIMRLAISTRAVHEGIIVAGATIFIAAVMQSLAIILFGLASG